MKSLPPRKFELGQMVWVPIGKEIHSAKIWGYEDGRNLWGESFNGWVYYAKVVGIDGEIIADLRVREDQLEPIETRG